MQENLETKVKKYHNLTKAALKKISIAVPKNSALYEIAKDFKEMSENYFNDAEYYEKRGEILIALASYSYSHAWLDAGARLGLFDVKNDYKLFTLYK